MKSPFAAFRAAAAMCLRHRSLLLFGIALLFGTLAVFGARGYIAERLEIEKARLVPRQATVEVVVARRDLERGELVVPENMAVREVPLQYLPGSAIRPERFEQHIGARLDQPMRSGEPLLAGAIVGAERGSFSSRIRQGIRAMSILVDEVNSVSGMLQPGDRIDLIFSVRPPSPAGQPPGQEVTTTLMQDLAVLATGRQVRPGAEDGAGGRHFTAITVEVTPAQAQQLIVAQRTGKLTAMLRHPDDRTPLGARALDLNALLGITQPASPRAAVAPLGPELIVGGRGALVAMQMAPPVAPSERPIGGMQAPPMPAASAVFAAPAGPAKLVPPAGASAPAMPETMPWSLRRPGAAAAADTQREHDEAKRP
ncbi:MAG: Flp pilus assembly protein CpaB [Burkholderiales bacterium]|nr:Flp pilus assembly protein CpaB [Burkholderiales bacterium]OJX08699.1 MAG: Flp pilus assembly protein CpaB [Burkholderiales bacterium 70-64]